MILILISRNKETNDEKVLCHFGKLPCGIIDQYICLVCRHILGVSANPVNACYIGHGRYSRCQTPLVLTVMAVAIDCATGKTFSGEVERRVRPFYK